MANLNDRKVRITYVGERGNYSKISRTISRSVDFLDIDYSLESIATSRVREKNLKDYLSTSIETSETDDEVDKKLMDSQPNMVIFDYKSLDRSIMRASRIKKHLPHVKTFVRVDYDGIANELVQSGPVLSFVHEKGVDVLVVQDEEENEDTTLTKLVRDLCYRPLSVGVIGLGDLGIDWVKGLAQAPYVSNIIVWSERAPTEGIIDLLESTEKSFVVAKSLEELAMQSQVVVICSSALRKTDAVRIAKNPDRSDLYPHEKPKMEGCLGRMSDAGFEGIIMMKSNPIGNLLGLTRNTKMPPNKGTSSFAIDQRRLMNCLDLPKDYDPDERDMIWHGIVGYHGVPRLVTDKVTEAQIALAESGARKVGYLSQAEAQKRRTRASASAIASLSLLEDIANYRRHLRPNIYCDLGVELGFAAVPGLYDPKKGTFVPDEKMIDLIGREEIYSILRETKLNV